MPTLVYADGTAQTNPSLAQVKEKLAALAPELRLSRGRLTSCPGSGPPYQCSTSERRDRDPAGQHQRAGLGLGLISRAGEPAGVLDLVARRRGSRSDSRARRGSPASGWPAAARAGCRSRSPRRPGRRPPRRPRGVRRPRASRPARRSRPASSSGPAGQTPGGPSRQRSSSGAGLARGDDHDHGRVGARELRACRSARTPARARPAAARAARRSAGSTGWRRATPRARSRGRPAAPASTPSPARCGSRPRSPTQSPRPPAPAAGSTHDGEPGAAVLLAEQHPRARPGASAGGDPVDRAVDGPDPGAGDDEHPRARVGPRLRRARPRRRGGRRCGRGGSRPAARCGKVTCPRLARGPGATAAAAYSLCQGQSCWNFFHSGDFVASLPSPR